MGLAEILLIVYISWVIIGGIVALIYLDDNMLFNLLLIILGPISIFAIIIKDRSIIKGINNKLKEINRVIQNS